MRVFGYGAQTAGGTMEPVQFEREPLRPGEVAITITHCGVCHTDWHMVRNDFKSSLFPIVPGHEITGVVTEVGAGVKKFAVGDRVGIGCMINSCRQCEPCQRGDEQYCEGAISCTFTYNGTKVPTGKNTYGGYSTQIIVREEFVVRIPAGLSNAEAAPLLCAGVTTYQPMKQFGLREGQTLGVAGFGGLGHIATQIGKAMGAKVIVLTTNADKAADATKLGADQVVSMDDAQTLQRLNSSLDLLLNTVPYPYDPTPYINLMKPNTTFVLVGNIIGFEAFATATMVFSHISIAGTLIGGIADTQFVLDFCANHKIRPMIEIIDIAEIQRAFERTERKEARYRHVIDMKTFAERIAEFKHAPVLPQESRNEVVGRKS